jgi:hypothetical protein
VVPERSNTRQAKPVPKRAMFLFFMEMLTSCDGW